MQNPLKVSRSEYATEIIRELTRGASAAGSGRWGMRTFTQAAAISEAVEELATRSHLEEKPARCGLRGLNAAVQLDDAAMPAYSLQHRTLLLEVLDILLGCKSELLGCAILGCLLAGLTLVPTTPKPPSLNGREMSTTQRLSGCVCGTGVQLGAMISEKSECDRFVRLCLLF